MKYLASSFPLIRSARPMLAQSVGEKTGVNSVLGVAPTTGNFVKKAVNWALRQIGKRNRKLNRQAIETAREIQKLNSKSARWIAADALRELTNDKVQSRIKD